MTVQMDFIYFFTSFYIFQLFLCGGWLPCPWPDPTVRFLCHRTAPPTTESIPPSPLPTTTTTINVVPFHNPLSQPFHPPPPTTPLFPSPPLPTMPIFETMYGCSFCSTVHGNRYTIGQHQDSFIHEYSVAARPAQEHLRHLHPEGIIRAVRSLGKAGKVRRPRLPGAEVTDAASRWKIVVTLVCWSLILALLMWCVLM